MPKLRDAGIEGRIYTRQRGDAAPRYYADFRDFEDVGGQSDYECGRWQLGGITAGG